MPSSTPCRLDRRGGVYNSLNHPGENSAMTHDTEFSARMPASFDEFWMPFTANRRYKQAPRLLVGADGMYYRTADGGTVLDGTAGLWCCNAGHGRRRISAAVQAQLDQLDYAPTFQMGHPLPFVTAARLAALAPSGLNRVFFANSGSEAVES